MKESLEKAVVLTLFTLFALLPWRLQSFVALIASSLLWVIRSDMRKTTETNIALCFPELPSKQQKQLAKKSIYHTVMVALELPKVWSQAAEKSLQQIVDVEGKALLDQAIQQGKGVIVIAPHLGNWEYLGLYLGQYYQSVSLYQPPRREWMEDITRQGREKTGSTLVPTNKKGVLALLKALKASGVTGILPDQMPERDSGTDFVPFFGQVVPTMTLIPSLIRRGNIIAVTGFAQRLAGGKFKIIFQSVPELIYHDDEQQSTLGLNQAVEQLVNTAPEQYQWEYKRFRRGNNNERRRVYQ